MLDLLGTLGAAQGIETDVPSYEFARSRHRPVKLVDGSLIPFPDESFELVTALDVMEHVADAPAFLAEIRRVASPGCWGVFTVPASPRLWSNHDVLNGHYRRYTRDLLASHLEVAGWEVVEVFHFNWVLYPAAAAVRLAERLRRSVPAENQVDASSSIGGLGTFAFSVENRLRQHKICAPFGLSLLAVAQNTRPDQPVL
jgi:SAM-dependent methyltransferase